MSSYVLKPKTPVRALVLAGILVVPGVVVTILAAALQWPVAWLVVGLVLFALGVIVIAVMAFSVQKAAIKIELDDHGYRVQGPGLEKRGDWLDVSKVRETPDGSRLVIAHGQVRRTHIVAARGGEDPQMRALAADLSQRLSAH